MIVINVVAVVVAVINVVVMEPWTSLRIYQCIRAYTHNTHTHTDREK